MQGMETLLQQLSAGGWADFDEAKLAQLEQAGLRADQEEARRQAAIVHAALGNDAGAQFMAWLIGKTLHRPPGTAEMAATTAEAYAIAKARREGQNQIVFMILSALAAARGEPDQPLQETDQ